MRIERVFYPVSDLDKETTDEQCNEIELQLNDLLGRCEADWVDEEFRLELGDVTYICFKLTFLEEEPEKQAGDGKTTYKIQGGLVTETDIYKYTTNPLA